MFVNLKYLIVTIAAIFFALGIGIMIGFNLNNSEILSNQQVKLVEDLDAKLNELRIENDELQIDFQQQASLNESYTDLLDNYSDMLLKDLLIGRNIIILQSTDDYSFPELNEFYAASGVNIGYHAVLKPIETNQNINPVKYPEIFEGDIIDSSKLYTMITEDLINKNNERIGMYAQDGIIEIVYQNESEIPISNLILVGGSLEKDQEIIENMDNSVISAAKRLNINIIGAEDSTAVNSYIQDYKNQELSTVDNLDQTIGKISLAFLISGKSGNYGSKDTADNLFPKLN